MTRRRILRQPRLMHAAVGATIVAGPASAALADAGGALKAQLQSHRLSYGQAVVVNGRAPSDGGQVVALEFAPAGSNSWQEIGSGRVGADGSFHLAARLRSSGSVRVTTAAGAASPLAVAAAGTEGSSSAPQHVTVTAALRTRRRARALEGARAIVIRGELLPAVGRRRVLLQGLRGRRWKTLAGARTRPGGRFAIRYPTSVSGLEPLRLHFRGDAGNAGTSARAGSLTVLHPTLASWYDDAGSTACGFHAYYGVANLSLPCGTRVSFRRGGRRVTAVVDDRGPYVGGREWDLNQNTAAALGFAGVGTVWASR